MSDKELKQPTKQDVLDYIKKGLQKKEDTLNVSIELDEKEEKDISKDVEEAKAQVEGGEIKQDRVHIPPSENKASSENLDAFDESRTELLKKYNLIPSKSEMEGFLKDTLFSRPIEFDVSIINGLVKAHYKSISNKANMLVADLRKDLDMYSYDIPTSVMRFGWVLSFLCITKINDEPFKFHIEVDECTEYKAFKKDVLEKLEEYACLPSETASLYSTLSYLCEERFRYVMSNFINEDFYNPPRMA